MQKTRTFERSLLLRPGDRPAFRIRAKTHATDSRSRVSYFLLSDRGRMSNLIIVTPLL